MISVLVVDDDFMVAGIHARFVERTAGFEVAGIAASGQQALADIDRLSPDLVLLDVHLPDVSGLEVLRRLRAGGNDIGVIMVTAAREADTVRSAAAGGASHYLIKPFEYADLEARLEVFRMGHAALTRDAPAAQKEVDAVFPGMPGPRDVALPKGLSAPTAESVLRTLREHGELSAAECAEQVGLSRVTARRYLEHFVERGQVTVRLRYGKAGRPERRYTAG
jgi:response regulator of citrate/malate metabolism